MFDFECIHLHSRSVYSANCYFSLATNTPIQCVRNTFAFDVRSLSLHLSLGMYVCLNILIFIQFLCKIVCARSDYFSLSLRESSWNVPRIYSLLAEKSFIHVITWWRSILSSKCKNHVNCHYYEISCFQQIRIGFFNVISSLDFGEFCRARESFRSDSRISEIHWNLTHIHIGIEWGVANKNCMNSFLFECMNPIRRASSIK